MKLLFFFLALSASIGFSQGMKITWEDSKGREFSIDTHTGSFQYSMISGDKLYYNSKYDSGPEGSIKSIGNVSIYYYGKYDIGPEGFVKSVGNVRINYNGKYDTGPEGTIKSVGGLTIYYNGKYDSGPEGTIKSTSGSVNR
ncbi:MAG: hypothetical protein RLZ33_2596 [Bacteroidota bacterium]